MYYNILAKFAHIGLGGQETGLFLTVETVTFTFLVILFWIRTLNFNVF